MKKILIVALYLLFCICSISSGIAYASEPITMGDNCIPYMTKEEFFERFPLGNTQQQPRSTGLNMQTYFENLHDFSAKNSECSCAYVSLIQILSYYDTFINDGIIPESYERNQGIKSSLADVLSSSPGVLNQAYPIGGGQTLSQHIQNTKSSDYQMYLMDIVNTALANENSNHVYTSQTGMSEYCYILDEIFTTQNVTFTYEYVPTAECKESENVTFFDSYVKSYLDAGKPVIVYIYYEVLNTTTGLMEPKMHSVVAYYYDSQGIHANFGWGRGSTDVVIANYPADIYAAGVLNVNNVPHVHSDNYLVNDTEYCGCGYSHTHDYDYTSIGESEHTKACECGKAVTEEHDIVVGEVSNSCSKCSYVHNHSYTYVSLGEFAHRATCSCGKRLTLEHDIVPTENGRRCTTCSYTHTHYYYEYTEIDDEYHTATCDCGSITQEHDIVEGLTIDYCSKCTFSHTHNYNDYQKIDEDYHYKICSCGAQVEEVHELNDDEIGFGCSYCSFTHTHSYTYQQFNSLRHKKVCSCGTTIEEHNFVSNEFITYCTECMYISSPAHVHNLTYTSCNDGARHVTNCSTCTYSVTQYCIARVNVYDEEPICMHCGQVITDPDVILRAGEEITSLQDIIDAYVEAYNSI